MNGLAETGTKMVRMMRLSWCWTILLAGYNILVLPKLGLSREVAGVPEPVDSVEQAQERERAQNTLTPEQVLETIHTTDL